MGYNVSGLSDYVYTKKDLLIKNVVLGFAAGDTIRNLTKQLGIKEKARLNYLDVSTNLQNGKGCGFTASGSTEFTERELETAIIKVNDEWCPDDLLGKYYEYEVRLGADDNANTLPFEEEIANGIAAGIDEKLEKLIWQGSKASGDLMNGFLNLATSGDSASTVNVTIATGTSVYDAIKAVILKVPENIYDKAVVFVAPAVYRQYIMELVEKNYFHYDPAFGEPLDMYFPGTPIKVHKTMGLTGDKRHIYASCWENMFYGSDLMDDKEQFRFWFSDDNDKHRLKVKFNAGVLTAFPDAVVLGTASADLV